MTSATLNDPKTRVALEEAARWRLIALLLERPREGWHEEVEALASEITDLALVEAAKTARAATEGIHLTLFAEGGFVSPRECTWRHREDPGPILADIGGFHEAFAFKPLTEDPRDHVTVAASFIGYLFLKEAHALAGGDCASAEITAEARSRFIDSHVTHFIGQWAERVASTGVLHLTVAALSFAEGAKVLASKSEE